MLQVRQTNIRGMKGYIVCGTNRHGLRVQVVTIRRDEAERLRKAFAHSIPPDDMQD